jgi:hypothetical protein
MEILTLIGRTRKDFTRFEKAKFKLWFQKIDNFVFSKELFV